MDKRYKYLSKNILLFAISSIAPKIISFLMVPLYTSYLSTAEYGTGDIVITTASLALPIFSLSIYSAVLRFGFDPKYTKGEVLTSGLYVLMQGFVLCTIVAFVIGAIPVIDVEISYLISFLMFFITNGLYEVFTNYARCDEKINVIVEMSVTNTFSTCVLNLFLLTYFKMGLNGYLTANYLGTLISVLVGVLHLKAWKQIKIKSINKGTVKKLKSYSAPLVLNRIGWWINNSSDRYIVTWLLGASSNGVYTVAYKIPTILTAFSDVFSQAWQLSAIKEFDKDDADNFVSGMYDTYNAFLVLCCSILIIFCVPIAQLLYSKDFFCAWRYVPFLLLSFLFNGLAAFFGSIFVAVKDSKIISSSTVLAAIINSICNVLLILLLKEAMGAAIATTISYMIIWLQRYIHSKKYIKLHICIHKHFFEYFLLLIQSIVCLTGFTMVSIIIQCIIFSSIFMLNIKEIYSIAKKILKR